MPIPPSPPKVRVYKGGTLVGDRRGINLVEGSNTTLTMADNPATGAVDVTVTTVGAGGTAGAPQTVKYVTLDTHIDIPNAVTLGTALATGAFASRPSAGTAGLLYLPNDGVAIGRDTGSAYQEWGPLFPLAGIANRPTTWNNQGSATETVTSGGAYLDAPTGTYNDRRRVKAAPSTPYTITACILPNLIDDEMFCGLLWMLNSSGASVNFGVTAAGQIQVWKNTSATVFSALYVGPLAWVRVGPVWLRIGDDGTDRTCEVSADGRHWTLIHTVGRTDFITPDRVGWSVLSLNPTYRAGATLLSWLETP